MRKHHHLHHQHSADLAYQLSIYQLQAVKCCLSFFFLSFFKNGHHTKTKTTFKDKSMNPFSFFFLKHQSQYFCFVFFKLGTRYSTVNLFFFNTSFGCWHLKTWTPKVPQWLKGQTVFSFFFLLFKSHTLKSYSPLASCLFKRFLKIKGRFSTTVSLYVIINPALWPLHQSFSRPFLLV